MPRGRSYGPWMPGGCYVPCGGLGAEAGGLEGESWSSRWEREGFRFVGGPGWLMRLQMP